MSTSSRSIYMNNGTIDVDYVYAAVECACAVAAVVGNALVVCVFCRYVVLRTVTNYYVISLAVADLLVGLVGIPSAIATSVGLPRDFHACLLMTSLLMLLCTSSIFSLVAITIDRFWAIMYPFSYTVTMTNRKAMMVIAGCWTSATVIGLLPVMGWNRGWPPEARCFFTDVMAQRYLMFIFVFTIVVPSIVMAIAYARIYRVVKQQVRRLSFPMLPNDKITQRKPSLSPWKHNLPRHPEEGAINYSEAKAAKSIAVIVVLFLVSWMPLYVLNTTTCVCPNCRLSPSVFKVAIVLSHCNSVWNPALYAWAMSDFKDCLRRLLTPSTNCCERRGGL